ncbi:MAG: cyclic nucleotide-binding domain-containing protein [Deltaproteobacteria bacterium]|nr:cyclic nucleotide-binding domain-containing protein [Deltaproteobacteria bacterium]
MRKVLYLFGKFTDQDIDWLIGAGTREDVGKGRALIQEGQPVEKLYLTLSGSFAVSTKNKQIATIGPGEVVGELSFLDSRPPSATVTGAESEGVVVSFSVKRLRSKLKVDTAFASRFYLALGVMLADRMRQNVQMLAPTDARALDKDVEAYGEIAPELLDESGLAGARFDKLRRTFLGG